MAGFLSSIIASTTFLILFSVAFPTSDLSYLIRPSIAITVQKDFAFMPVGERPREEDFPKPLAPIDDLQPATVITHLLKSKVGELTIRGVTMDNGDVRRVTVNGLEARPTEKNFAQWEVTMELTTGVEEIVATAEDAVGNVEKTPAVVKRN